MIKSSCAGFLALVLVITGILFISGCVKEETAQPNKLPIESVIAFDDPLISDKESRNMICSRTELALLDYQTQENFKALCDARYDALSMDDGEKIGEMIDIASSISSRAEANDFTKAVASSLLDSSLPPLPEDAVLPSSYDEFLQECEKMRKGLMDRCPAEGFSSWYYRESISFYEGDTSSKNTGKIKGYYMGGPCLFSRVGPLEETKVDRFELSYKSFANAGKGTDQKRDVFCTAYCNSYNCPQREAELQGLCNEGFIVYYPLSKTSINPNYETEIVDEALASECNRRGKTYYQEGDKIKSEDMFDCRFISNCSYSLGLDNQVIKYCCCSCDRPKREPLFQSYTYGAIHVNTSYGANQIKPTANKPVNTAAAGKENTSGQEEEYPEKEEVIESFEEAVCGDKVITFPEVCDGTEFNQQCIDSLEDYKEMMENPGLSMECYNNCRGCQIARQRMVE